MKTPKNKQELNWITKHSKMVFIPLLFIILISVATSMFSVAFVLVSRDVIDTATGSNHSALFSKSLLMLLTVLLQLALQSFGSIISNRATIKLETHLKLYLYDLMLKKDWIQISRFHSGDLMSRMTSDISHVTSGVMGIIPGLISLITQLLSAFFVLLFLDSTFAIVVLMVGPAMLLFGNYYSKKVKHLHIACQESDSAARSFLQESLQNLMLTKAFCNETFSTKGYRSAIEKNNKVQIKRNLFSVLSGIGLSLGFWFGYIFAIAWGAYRLTTGHITFGTMAAFLQLASQIQSPFIALTRSFPRIYATFASAGRLIHIEELAEEAVALIQPQKRDKNIERLIMDNVSFSYAEEKILDNISLDLTMGQFAILEGASGEGKTTMLRILLGLIAPTNGQAYLTDTHGKIIDINPNSRSYFTYVPQGNTVLSGTIEENITYGLLDVMPEEIWECIKTACLYDFIMELPDKLNTVVGERGTGISEGQAQRIAIARALLRKSPILLMDEATSALDEATEAILLENLRKHIHDRICIFVSHRKSITKLCDRAFLLEHGQIIEVKKLTISA